MNNRSPKPRFGVISWLFFFSLLSAALPAVAYGAPESFQQALNKGWGWGYVFAFAGGMMTCFTPCVYPLVAITMSIFVGAEKTGKLKSMGLTGLYTLGLAVTMSVLGLVAGMAGGVGLGVYMTKPYVVIPLALLFIALAASMFGAFELRLPSSINEKLNRIGGAGPLGAFLMGLAGGLVALPCTGPVLAGILAFVGVQGNPFLGFTLLFTYAIGFGLMFWVIATFSMWMPKSGPWMEGVKSFFGAVLCVAAIYFLGFMFPSLRRFGSHHVWFLAAAVFVSIIGVTAGALHLSYHATNTKIRIRKTAGLLILVAGMTGILHHFITPKDLPAHRSGIEEAMTDAKEKSRPVIMDFWAIHCLPCLQMDRETFAHPEVKKIIESHFEFVKVDCSNDTPDIRKIRKKYNAIQLPTVVILDPEGNVLHRLHGFTGPEKMLKMLKKTKKLYR